MLTSTDVSAARQNLAHRFQKSLEEALAFALIARRKRQLFKLDSECGDTDEA